MKIILFIIGALLVLTATATETSDSSDTSSETFESSDDQFGKVVLHYLYQPKVYKISE